MLWRVNDSPPQRFRRSIMRFFPPLQRPIGYFLLPLVFLGGVLVGTALTRERSASPRGLLAPGPLRDAARALRLYLATRDPTFLAGARVRLGGQPGGRSGPEHELLEGLTRYLHDGPQSIPTPLFRAVLRELTEGDGARAQRLLDVKFLGLPLDEAMESEDAFLRTIANCSLPSRLHQEEPADVIAFMGIAPGQDVVDVGSGPGFFTFPLVRAVGPTGRVYAVEVNERMGRFVRRHAEEQDIGNLRVVQARLDDITLPAESTDHAFMTHMFVDIELNYPADHRQRLFGSVRKALRPGGRFTVCEPYVIGRDNLTQEQLVERLVDYGFRADTRPAPHSRLASFNCVRVLRP
jgi:SAM-dependent methyltransferase